jgi:hypothetical protein
VTLTKQWKKQDNTNDGPSEEVPQNEKEIDWNNFTVPTGTPIDLTELFNKKLTFNYIFTMASARITNGGGGPSEKFIVDMVILLPLEFKLDGVPKSTNFLGYRKLELDGMGGGGSEDLLGRTKGEDDIFSGLKSVKIKFYDYKNNIIEGLWLGIKSKPILSLGKGETAPDPIEFTGEELEPPFNPTFELLVPDGESFKILRPQDGDSTIDFSIAVEVKTNLDIAL